MPDVELAAMSAGETVFVTPNNRLARDLVARHDTARLERGMVAWPAVRALPWSAWIRSLWLDALAAGAWADARALLAPAASALLWSRIVADAGDLLDAQGAADAAAEAWDAFHAWRDPGESLEAWQHAGIEDDAATFSRWATRYRAALDARHLLDAAEVADALTSAAKAVPAWRDLAVVLTGFLEWTPQQQRLLDALAAAGMRITIDVMPPARESNRSRVACDTAELELAAALAHARAVLLSNPATRVGIIVSDLATRRDAVIAAAENMLCPELIERAERDAPRPYDVSLGQRLADIPLVAVALRLIEWSASALPVATAAAVLRSPYLAGDADAWLFRSRLEREWREAGVQRVTLAAAMSALPPADPMAALWKASNALESGRMSAELWAHAWRTWLASMGWPGARPLGSNEWQARDAWWRLLGTFAKLDDLIGSANRNDAIGILGTMARRAIFAPESQGAPIQILGMLEATGLEFDLVWVTGLAADRWPPASAPHALLPLAWQRRHGVPQADAARTLAHAGAVTDALARSAPIVIASHAERENDAQRTVSSLVAHWPIRHAEPTPGYAGRVRAMASGPVEFESLPDAMAPPVDAGTRIGGGVAIVESQSACAFQAFARFRLRLDAWPPVAAGLSPAERGLILHAALAAFWQATQSHANLSALTVSELDGAIEISVRAGLTTLDARRWRTIPSPIAAAEADRLASVIRAWLDTIERPRPPFTVEQGEATHVLALGGLEFRLRIDRVDRLESGGRAVIDYKSGRAIGPSRWFATRPAGTQLGLYALALDAESGRTAGASVRAVAFGQLKAGAVKLIGLAADPAAWPQLTVPGSGRQLPVADWAAATTFWQQQYGALATAFRAGVADVLPRNAQDCRYCEMQSLCRIQRLDDPIAADPDGPTEDDDDDA